MVAGSSLLGGAVGALAGSAYGERVHAGDPLAVAERGVAETLCWHLRILAGWLPAGGAALVRTLAARLELENIDARLGALEGDGREPRPFELGGLAIAWPRIAQARTVEEAAEALGRSAWGVDGGRSAADLAIGLRVSWARRVWESVPEGADWVLGASALLVARELLVAESRAHVTRLGRLPGIRPNALGARTVGELRSALPERAAWALADVGDPGELWKAELAWWSRVEQDAAALRRSRGQRAVVLAVVALMAADARRVARALAAADAGGSELAELADGAV